MLTSKKNDKHFEIQIALKYKMIKNSSHSLNYDAQNPDVTFYNFGSKLPKWS